MRNASSDITQCVQLFTFQLIELATGNLLGTQLSRLYFQVLNGSFCFNDKKNRASSEIEIK